MKTARSMKDNGLSLLTIGKSFILLSGCFLYFWLWVNPTLIFQTQEPVFFSSNRFLLEHLTWPGGVVEYLSALLGQFYYYPAAGALVLTMICWKASIAMGWLYSFFKPVKANYIFLVIPSILLLGLSSLYTYNLSFSIGLLITLFMFNLLLKGAAGIPAIRPLLFWILAIVNYYLAGGFVILFILLYIIYLLFHYKKLFDILAVLLVIPAPWITAQYLAYISLHDACFTHLPVKGFTVISVLAWSLWIYILAIMFIGWLMQRRSAAAAGKEPARYLLALKNKTLAGIVQISILLLLIAGVILSTGDSLVKSLLTTDYLARHHQWQQLLDYQTGKSKSSLYEVFETNRALYHSGKLLDEMFAFPQNWGTNSLFLTTQFSELSLLHNSDLDYDLGYYNGSLHWVYEAVSMRGETGFNLQRLALLHLLKGEKNSARRYLSSLHNTIPFKKWAMHYLAIMNNDSLLQIDPELQDKFTRSISQDFMNYQSNPEANLINILQADPGNKMAFEYYMAACLLNRQWGTIVKNIPVFRQMGYTNLPFHIQEALLIYMAQNRINTLDVSDYSMNIKIKTQFSAFQQLMSRFRNKTEAQTSMYESFRHTYWYYALYPPVQPNSAAGTR
ncbi:MAG TPA: DUF6057 family protein [bacterium]|nr:DUF6057 family protein [bacterium]HPN45943.1 DUF6057 family protein [bacterium]